MSSPTLLYSYKADVMMHDAEMSSSQEALIKCLPATRKKSNKMTDCEVGLLDLPTAAEILKSSKKGQCQLEEGV